MRYLIPIVAVVALAACAPGAQSGPPSALDTLPQVRGAELVGEETRSACGPGCTMSAATYRLPVDGCSAVLSAYRRAGFDLREEGAEGTSRPVPETYCEELSADGRTVSAAGRGGGYVLELRPDAYTVKAFAAPEPGPPHVQTV